jgi:flagellar basal-body rod protein FlgC
MADLLDTFNVAASGLSAERLRLQTIATNMANAHTTRTEAGGPYQRRVPTFEAQSVDPFGDEMDRATNRVVVTGIQSDGKPPQRVYDPTHPDADASGYVSYPDINVLQEMVDLMTTSRTYEANASVVEATKDMAMRALDIGRS